MGLTLLDSNVVSAYLDAGNSLHRSAAEALEDAVRGRQDLAISAVSWAELLNGVKGGHLPEIVLREFVVEFHVAIYSTDAEVAEIAAELQHAYRTSAAKRTDAPKLRAPDALILATAVRIEACEQVITGDAKWANVAGVAATITVITAGGPA